MYVSTNTLTLSHFPSICHQVQNRPLKPGQMNVTQETYDQIVLQQLREIWTRYGTLDEIWFDGGSVSLSRSLCLSSSSDYVPFRLIDTHNH